MTAEEIIQNALNRLAEMDIHPATISSPLGRMTRYQEQLFARGAVINREFFGADVAAPVVDNRLDTNVLDPIPMRLQVVRIADPGTSPYALGQRVALMHADDIDSEFPPRCFYRDGILQGVLTDLDGVPSLHVYYSKRPLEITNKTDIPQLPIQFHELLVLDLAKWYVRRQLGLTPTARKEAIEILSAEEDVATADFEAFLKDWAFPETSRFGSTAQQTR